MTIDWWTLGLQTVNLLVLLWLLGRFLFRPMAAIVQQRQAAADKLLQEAADKLDKAQEAVKAAQAEQDAIAAKRDDLIAAAHKEAERQRDALIEAAHQDVKAQRAQAEDSIAHMRSEEETRLDHRASELATDIAARLLAAPAADLPVSAFLDGLEQALGKLPETSREAMRTAGAPLALSSARELGEDELKAVRATIARALGDDVALDVSVDKDLIAGLRLSSDTAVVEANLRADLDRVLAGLNGHGG